MEFHIDSAPTHTLILSSPASPITSTPTSPSNSSQNSSDLLDAAHNSSSELIESSPSTPDNKLDPKANVPLPDPIVVSSPSQSSTPTITSPTLTFTSPKNRRNSFEYHDNLSTLLANSININSKIESNGQFVPLDEVNFKKLFEKVKSLDDNYDDILEIIEDYRYNYSFNSNQLYKIVELISSVKTKIKIISLISLKLIDPKSKYNEFISLFRYSEDKEVVEKALKSRIFVLNSSFYSNVALENNNDQTLSLTKSSHSQSARVGASSALNAGRGGRGLAGGRGGLAGGRGSMAGRGGLTSRSNLELKQESSIETKQILKSESNSTEVTSLSTSTSVVSSTNSSRSNSTLSSAASSSNNLFNMIEDKENNSTEKKKKKNDDVLISGFDDVLGDLDNLGNLTSSSPFPSTPSSPSSSIHSLNSALDSQISTDDLSSPLEVQAKEKNSPSLKNPITTPTQSFTISPRPRLSFTPRPSLSSMDKEREKEKEKKEGKTDINTTKTNESKSLNSKSNSQNQVNSSFHISSSSSSISSNSSPSPVPEKKINNFAYMQMVRNNVSSSASTLKTNLLINHIPTEKQTSLIPPINQSQALLSGPSKIINIKDIDVPLAVSYSKLLEISYEEFIGLEPETPILLPIHPSSYLFGLKTKFEKDYQLKLKNNEDVSTFILPPPLSPSTSSPFEVMQFGYSYKELLRKKIFNDYEEISMRNNLEQHLIHQDFEKLFKMDLNQYNKLMKWKQIDLKKKVNLF